MESISILPEWVEDGSEFVKVYVNHSAYLENRMTENCVISLKCGTSSQIV